ncbi:hypothetical protein LQ567_04950 [Niabella pedocola]|uniref:HTH cro/C1-type domain-containing protein n=1 Tax=Niabella pedocola TaxID=1752077 RepID=A0ABS8PLW9_9BACT|nr:hypothetical protein [Niabella pedocola]MCD2422099.1 hypothetical protein [Niabella pedocola]
MKPIANALPISVSEQARLLNIPVAQIRRIYQGATNIPAAALEKMATLQRIWTALEESSTASAYTNPEAEHDAITDRFQQLQYKTKSRRLHLEYEAFLIEDRALLLIEKMRLMQQLVTAGSEEGINKKELDLQKDGLEEKINNAGHSRLPAIRMELALVKDMEQGIEEVLRKNIRFEI